MTLVHVQREFDKFSIRQRADDGYFSATDICQAAGKDWFDYFRRASTQEYLQVLSAARGLAISTTNTKPGFHGLALIQVFRGGNQEKGTWIHPEVASDLAQWCSPEFRVAVNCWVVNWLEHGRAILSKAESQTKLDAVQTPQLPSAPEQSLLAWRLRVLNDSVGVVCAEAAHIQRLTNVLKALSADRPDSPSQMIFEALTFHLATFSGHKADLRIQIDGMFRALGLDSSDLDLMDMEPAFFEMLEAKLEGR